MPSAAEKEEEEKKRRRIKELGWTYHMQVSIFCCFKRAKVRGGDLLGD